MNTQSQNIQNIADLVTVLMLNDKKFDMSTVEHCTTIEMQETGLSFRPINDVITDSNVDIDDDVQVWFSKFEDTEDYFFDAINAVNITESKIQSLVNLCIA
jgi:hypothetical protein